MSPASTHVPAHLDPRRVELQAPIRNWFGVGGRADRLVRPESIDELRTCLRMDSKLRVLGDGANILIDDVGVSELVVSLERDLFTSIEINPKTGRVTAGGGAKLPRLLKEATRQGLGGLEALGGIPATVGGAAVMNAGGRFGEIGPAIRTVHALSRDGKALTLSQRQCNFSYRHSALTGLVVTAVEFDLTPGDPARLSERLKEVIEYKKATQPPGSGTAGCCFRNPTLAVPVDSVGDRGQRVSAGLLIDRAGCKGLEIGGARVSEHHANFIITRAGARARDVMDLIEQIQRRVHDTFGVSLETEVVIWKRATPIEDMAR